MTNCNLTLGSLFDGSGGFPLGGILSGITPLWASEIEPFPIRVTTKRLPQVKHLGDISKINGGEIEPVDIITFGSPCTDMSIAGKRAGLEGKQSSLFYEAIRIVKEMRCKTNGTYPRFIVWENVLGAFSSNKGEDFRAVLEEICKIKNENVSIPKSKKWESAGEIVGEEFSLAWRVFDAQYWGVPQRRKRIYLVADFASRSARTILFESEGLSEYSKESFRAWQKATSSITESTGRTSKICLNDQGGSRMDITEDVTCTLRARSNHTSCVLELKTYDVCLKDKNSTNHRVVETEIARTLDTNGGHPSCNQGGLVVVNEPQHIESQNVVENSLPYVASQKYLVRRLTPTECGRLQGFPDWWCNDLETKNPSEQEIAWWRDVFETHQKVVGTTTKKKTDKQIRKWLENLHSDSAEYKMWGNGVALPNVVFVLSGIVYCVETEKCKEGAKCDILS